MGAPTWPPTPEAAHEATRKEYGEDARAVLAFETDEEAEAALLAPFLFGPAQRELVSGEQIGTALDAVVRPLGAWMHMVSGTDFTIGVSDPASTDGEQLFLPRALPAPLNSAEDALLYRCLGLVQVGLARWGLLSNRPLLAELHRDWVLRSTWHMLALRYIVGRWSQSWPGIAQDFVALSLVDKAWLLRVNLTVVPRQGLPEAFQPLYHGLSGLFGDAVSRSPLAAPAQRAVEAVEAIAHPAAAPLVIQGQAQALRQAFLRQRLGPPPLPYVAGIIRPEWWLHDLAADLKAAEAWKEGPKPLAVLRKAMARTEAKRSRLPESIRKRMRVSSGSGPPPLEALDLKDPPPPGSEDHRVYDEWDQERGTYRIAHTRVLEEPAPPGPLAHYQRIVDANQGPIKELRKRFAALRTEERWVHGLQDGTELDLNRAVAAVADIKAGFTPRVDWYKRFQRARETVAISVMVDLSGSTQGRIIHLEQEALVLFAEGLEVLGFPHILQGFSSQGARRCTVQRLKGFEETYDDEVHKRLGNLRPGGATRLGAFLRHATWQLSQRPEARRLLLLLSDGRPHDQGGYEGRQGLADAAMAVREATRQGVFVHCTSLDTQEHAEDDLKFVFGPGRTLLLQSPDELPGKLPEVFERLIR